MKHIKWLLTVAIIGMIFTGCSDDKSPTKSDANVKNGKLNASISGDITLEFKCNEAYGLQTKDTNQGQGLMQIQGIVTQGTDKYLIDIQVYHDPATGSYDLSFPAEDGVGTVSKNNIGNFSESGSVTFTEVSATRLKGTFSFTAFRMAGVGQKVTVTVSSGTFDVPVIPID